MPEEQGKTPRSSAEYPEPFSVPLASWATIGWMAFFFMLINATVFLMFSETKKFERFHYHVSYEEIRTQIDAIKHDPRKKIVFIGGSVMWGASTPDALNTIPAEFQKLIPETMSVYNLGLIGVRPVDEYLLAWLLKDDADLIILDENYEFGFETPHERLLREPETYVRMQQLFNAEGPAFLDAMPEMQTCLEKNGLPLPKTKGTIETSLRKTMERGLPVLRYKDRINDVLFGRHPSLLVDDLLTRASDIARGTYDIRSVLRPPEARIDPAPWKPTHSESETSVREHFLRTTFNADSLLLCLSASFGSQTDTLGVPTVVYLTPNNPGLFPGLHGSKIHNDNIELLTRMFGSKVFANMDDGSIDASLFADSTHLTPEGNAVLARKLWMVLKENSRFQELLR